MRCYSGNLPTYNQLKSNTCKAKEPCMLISPKDQDLAMQWTSSTSPLPWLSQATRASKKLLTSPFPTVHKSKFLTHSRLFSLKESARKSLMSHLSNPRVHTLKERQDSILFLLHTLSKKLKTQEALSFFHAYGSNTKKKENSLKLSTSHTFGSSH